MCSLLLLLLLFSYMISFIRQPSRLVSSEVMIFSYVKCICECHYLNVSWASWLMIGGCENEKKKRKKKKEDFICQKCNCKFRIIFCFYHIYCRASFIVIGPIGQYPFTIYGKFIKNGFNRLRFCLSKRRSPCLGHHTHYGSEALRGIY